MTDSMNHPAIPNCRFNKHLAIKEVLIPYFNKHIPWQSATYVQRISMHFNECTFASSPIQNCGALTINLSVISDMT
ncbi:hypothetical protein SAMN05216583_11645 [Selenomonas sp. KH1T6]|nr:hypothetical protein SAMN05216583_11645 [Selenomonas ruminantium]